MTSDTTERLSGTSRAAAEAYFGVPLGDVILHRGPEAARFGAEAMAVGNQIFLPAGPIRMELLGHELAHVVQQRQGRVTATFALNGWGANDDPGLEQEAEASGYRFAAGLQAQMPALPLQEQSSAVIQRAVSVAGKPITGTASLSAAAGCVLDLIEGGPAWMDWIIKNPSLHYHFSGEPELILGVQTGLHGTDLMLLPELGLQLHPRKLLEIAPEDLKLVNAAEKAAAANSVTHLQAKKVLAKHQLLSQSELEIGGELLSQTGVAAAPVFQATTLGDRISLFRLVDGASTEISLNPAIQKEAAGFALTHAQSPREFADFYQFYLSMVDDPTPASAGKGAAARGRKAEVSLEALQPLVFGLLFCPCVRGVPTPEQMHAIVQTWVHGGNRLGFARLSLAMSQIGQFADLKGATGETAAKTIDEFAIQAQNHIMQKPAASVTLSQEGSEWSYLFESRQALAVVSLASNGNVTLATFQPKK
jgi:hypothetical protein